MAKFEEAGPLFRQFHSSTPEAPHQWIGDYKEFANQFIEAFAEYQKISEKLRAANTVAERKAAVAAAKEVYEKIKSRGKLAALLADTIKLIEERTEVMEKEEAEKMAAQEAADAKTIEELRAQVPALLQVLKFAEARAVATAALPNGAAAKREQTLWLKRSDALAKYKATLIADINTAPATPQIRKKNGQTVAGAASHADDNGIDVRTPYGSTPVAWTDLSLDTIYNLGRTYIRQGLAAAEIGERAWNLGMFALLAGKPTEARTLFNAGAQNNPAFKDDLPMFLEALGEK
jgi:hypothetical protein